MVQKNRPSDPESCKSLIFLQSSIISKSLVFVFTIFFLSDVYSFPLAEIKSLALDGDVNSQVQLGLHYNKGKNKDYLEAYYWMKMAANKGSSIACRYIGRAHFFGRGTSLNIGLAQKWLKKAASSGNTDAMFDLGKSMINDKNKAAAWFKIAHSFGHESGLDEYIKITNSLNENEIQNIDDIIVEFESDIISSDSKLSVSKKNPASRIKKLNLGNGLTYWGQTSDGIPDGIGVKRLNGHTIYQGEFKQGIEHGYGTSFGKDGIKSYQGNWESGKPVPALQNPNMHSNNSL